MFQVKILRMNNHPGIKNDMTQYNFNHIYVCACICLYVLCVCVCVYTHLINIYTRFIFILQINWSFFHTPCVWHVTFGWGTTRVSDTWFLPSGRKGVWSFPWCPGLCQALTDIISVNPLNSTVVLNICKTISVTVLKYGEVE